MIKKSLIVSCDASTLGLGAVLLQEDNDMKKPVAHISRTLISAEKNYFNTDALVLTWAKYLLKSFLPGK